MSKRNEIAYASCCVVGGGPAGLMLGYLLARTGVEVVVLEKHRDFLRDFRGDTIHPSTLELFYELGLLDELLQLPHQEVTELHGEVGDESVTIADFSHLPTHCRFLAVMPQSEFLEFVVRQAQRHPNFRLMMQTTVTDLIEEQGQVRGVRAETPNGAMHVRAHLTVGTDGRHSAKRAGSEITDWQQVKVLTVAVDRLREWARPGLLCIGDAAHAMSPLGGVGINLAIQDAVATASILGDKILRHSVTFDDLRAVQKRRQFPTRVTQWLQLFLQNRVIRRVLRSDAPLSLPWILRLVGAWPVLRRIPAWLVGIGVRPEHAPKQTISSLPPDLEDTEVTEILSPARGALPRAEMSSPLSW